MEKIEPIWDLLRRRFPANEYALMEEVSDAAGFSRSRSADYIAVNLWPSRGLAINGIELKSYRSDWLSELKKPQKAEAIFQYCDYFWLLTTDESIAKSEEIPAAWGWLCVKGSRIVTMKEAPKLEAKPISRHFMAAMLKRACCNEKLIHISQIEDRIRTEREAEENKHKRAIDYAIKEKKDLEQIIQNFKLASGIELQGWRFGGDSKRIGEAVKFVLDGGTAQYEKRLKELQATANQINNNIAFSLSKLEAQPTPKEG